MQSERNSGISAVSQKAIWENLIRSGREAVSKQNFAFAIQAFTSACSMAKQSSDAIRAEECRQWLTGTMLEFRRVSGSDISFNRSVEVMESIVELRPNIMIEILLEVAEIFERQSRHKEAEYIYKLLLSRAMNCPAEVADEYCTRIQRQLFACRKLQGQSGINSFADWIG